MTPLDRQIAIARKCRFLERVTGLQALFLDNPSTGSVMIVMTADVELDGQPRRPLIRSYLYEDDLK